MIKFSLPVIVDDSEARPGIRSRLKYKNSVEYVLTFEDVNTIPGFPLEYLAQRLYGTPSAWFVIADANPIRNPSDWFVGDTVIIPTDFDLTASPRDRGIYKQ